jgi:hypothetical protein
MLARAYRVWVSPAYITSGMCCASRVDGASEPRSLYCLGTVILFLFVLSSVERECAPALSIWVCTNYGQHWFSLDFIVMRAPPGRGLHAFVV